HLDAHSGERAARATDAPPASGASRPGREDPGEVVGGRDLELVVAAVARLLIGPPAQKRRRVAEAVALQVVVLDLAHPLAAQRLPREILARPPAPLRPRPARAAALGLPPGPPRM